MRVRYIGNKKRINSFGTYEPGKEYDVEKDVAFSLLSVPILFQSVEQEEVKIEEVLGGGYQPNKSNLDTSDPPQGTSGVPLKTDLIKKKVNKRKKRKKWH